MNPDTEVILRYRKICNYTPADAYKKSFGFINKDDWLKKHKSINFLKRAMIINGDKTTMNQLIIFNQESNKLYSIVKNIVTNENNRRNMFKLNFEELNNKKHRDEIVLTLTAEFMKHYRYDYPMDKYNFIVSMGHALIVMYYLTNNFELKYISEIMCIQEVDCFKECKIHIAKDLKEDLELVFEHFILKPDFKSSKLYEVLNLDNYAPCSNKIYPEDISEKIKMYYELRNSI